MEVTYRQLKVFGACQHQLNLFKATFGINPVIVTEFLCLEHFDKFCWDWAADNLLSASARAEYQRATASPLAEYERAMESARAEYDGTTASALAEYQRVTISALAEYQRATASAFGKLAESI